MRPCDVLWFNHFNIIQINLHHMPVHRQTSVFLVRVTTQFQSQARSMLNTIRRVKVVAVHHIPVCTFCPIIYRVESNRCIGLLRSYGNSNSKTINYSKMVCISIWSYKLLNYIYVQWKGHALAKIFCANAKSKKKIKKR